MGISRLPVVDDTSETSDLPRMVEKKMAELRSPIKRMPRATSACKIARASPRNRRSRLRRIALPSPSRSCRCRHYALAAASAASGQGSIRLAGAGDLGRAVRGVGGARSDQPLGQGCLAVDPETRYGNVASFSRGGRDAATLGRGGRTGSRPASFDQGPGDHSGAVACRTRPHPAARRVETGARDRGRGSRRVALPAFDPHVLRLCVAEIDALLGNCRAASVGEISRFAGVAELGCPTQCDSTARAASVGVGDIEAIE